MDGLTGWTLIPGTLYPPIELRESFRKTRLTRQPVKVVEAMTQKLTPKQVAEVLQISLSQLCRMSKRGKIPCLNISDSPKNATWRYDPEELERWLRERRNGHPTTPHRGGVRRRLQGSTPVIRSANGASQEPGTKKEINKAHGTEYPVSEDR